MALPQTDLAEGFARLGFFNSSPDPDGLIRRMPLILRWQDDYYPSLALQTLSLLTDSPLRLHLNGERATLLAGERSIPIDAKGRLRLDFYGNGDQLPTLSAQRILKGDFDPALIRERAVLVGVTELGIADVRATPVSPSFPGVALHATALANMLHGDYLQRHQGALWWDLLLTALVPGLLVLGLARVQQVGGMVVIYLLSLVGVWWAWSLLMGQGGMLVSLFYPLLANTLAFLGFTLFDILIRERNGRHIRRAFASYVSPAIVKRLVEEPEALRLEGEMRELTVLFSDIRGFTRLSEQLAPDRLVMMLNQYLGPMTDILLQQRGTLDKYIGDAVMGLFNAPLNDPQHRQHAVMAAIGMQRELARLNQGFEAEFGTQLRIGIGIHTGPAVVGNIGSRRRFEYTAMGDTVNLASRLEGRTKYYAADVIISAAVAEALSSDIPLRRLDRIRVKGKQHPVEIYQVIWDHTPIPPHYEAALNAYFAGNFDQALGLLEGDVAHYPEDRPSALLRERCRAYLHTPPPQPWEGVHEAKDK